MGTPAANGEDRLAEAPKNPKPVDSREARLAAALRDNLKRRKAGPGETTPPKGKAGS